MNNRAKPFCIKSFSFAKVVYYIGLPCNVDMDGNEILAGHIIYDGGSDRKDVREQNQFLVTYASSEMLVGRQAYMIEGEVVYGKETTTCIGIKNRKILLL